MWRRRTGVALQSPESRRWIGPAPPVPTRARPRCRRRQGSHARRPRYTSRHHSPRRARADPVVVPSGAPSASVVLALPARRTRAPLGWHECRRRLMCPACFSAGYPRVAAQRLEGDRPFGKVSKPTPGTRRPVPALPRAERPDSSGPQPQPRPNPVRRARRKRSADPGRWLSPSPATPLCRRERCSR